MAATITVTEEAQAFFAQRSDPTLKANVDRLVEEFAGAMGDWPPVLDAIEDPETGQMELWIGVEVDPACAAPARERFHAYMRDWLRRSDRALRRQIGFGIRYR